MTETPSKPFESLSHAGHMLHSLISSNEWPGGRCIQCNGIRPSPVDIHGFSVEGHAASCWVGQAESLALNLATEISARELRLEIKEGSNPSPTRGTWAWHDQIGGTIPHKENEY